MSASSNQSNGTDYNGQFYLGSHASVYATYFSLSTLGIILGTLGNLTVITTVLFNKKLRTNSAYMLMMNLATADLGISIIVHTFTDVGIVLGEDFFGDKHAFCTFLAAICLVSCGTSLVSMGVLAVNRYLNICHHNVYAKVFTFKRTIGFCVFAWIAGIVVDIPNFVGWGGHFFDPKTANCIWDRLASESYSLFFATSAIFAPCVCIFICYMRIFIFAYKSKTRVSTGREMAQSLKVTRSLFASFALFTVCWVPYGIIVSIDFKDQLPMGVHALATLGAHINSTFNPLVYMLFNPAFKESFFRVVARCFKFNVSRVNSETGTQTNNNNNNNITKKALEVKSLSQRPSYILQN